MNAEHYSRIIAGELYALDTIISTTDPDEIASCLAELELDPDTDPSDAVAIWLNETALDLAIKHDTRGADYPSRIEILRTAGGPHCEITRDTNDGAAFTVSTYSGSDTYHHRTHLDNLADYLDELTSNH